MFGKKILWAFVAGFLFFAVPPPAAHAGSITIVNQSASNLNAIYISDSGEGDWEENIIEGLTLPSGNELEVQINGSYSKFDLRVEAAGGGEEDYYEFPGKTRRIIIKGGGNSEYQ